MARSGRERLSRGELLRQRGAGRFVGRRDQLSLFAQNLERDDAEAVFVFHVRGLGGVGKSTLVRQWRETARSAGALTVLVDERDVHGVPQALSALARQISAATGDALREFDEAVKAYRREQAAVAGGEPANTTASLPSRFAVQAVVGGAGAFVPGGAAVGAMANQDALARGLDRVWGATVGRGRREREGDVTGVSKAFVAELNRVSEDWPRIVLFFDTWERGGPYLDGWLPGLLQDGFGRFPSNVIVVLAGRDELSEREWAPLREDVRDVPLKVFTREETRTMLARRGVSEPEVVDAVLKVSMGLPLLTELLAQTGPATAAEVERGGDVVDLVVERFVQWIEDPHQRETVLACALALELNEDVFTAAAPPEGRELWGWLCGQSFVSGHGDFKRYHAVVRSSMIRRLRVDSPQRWKEIHGRLADAQAARLAEVEEELAQEWAARREAGERTVPDWARWADERWRRYRAAETYHRLCASPRAGLGETLEHVALAAWRDPTLLRQWTEVLDQAAGDSADPELLAWSERLPRTITDEHTVLACLTTVLADSSMTRTSRARILACRGDLHAEAGHDQQAMNDLDHAVSLAPRDHRTLSLRGEAHRLAGRLEEAVADFTAALALDPTQAWARASRGQAHREAGRLEEAVTDLTAALALDPTQSWALIERGLIAQMVGRFDEAVTDLTAAFDLVQFAGALVLRGRAHRLAGRFEEAVADFTAALDLDPTSDWALAERGEAHRLAGRFEEAVADFTAALVLDPGYAWALASRGQAHREAGRPEEAVADLSAALDLDADMDWALAQRGQAHRQMGRFEEAVADFTAALVLDPGYVWALAGRGQAHREAGRPEEAVADLSAALALDSDADWALAQRGQAHRQMGRFEEAVADFTAALVLDPGYVWALAGRGQAHREAGRPEEAVADLSAALALDSDADWALAQRGEIHRQMGRFEEAVADFTAALVLDPGYAWALASRGQAHREAGRPEEAVIDLSAALDLDADMDWALAQRGEAYRQMGCFEEAVTDFTDALDLDPSHVWARAQRGVVHRQAGHYGPARADLERASASEPEDRGYQFERLLLETLVSGLAAQEQQWTELFGSLAGESSDEDVELFRVLLLSPGSDIAEATRVLLATRPSPALVTDVRLCLAELFATDTEPAGQARRCHQLLAEYGAG